MTRTLTKDSDYVLKKKTFLALFDLLLEVGGGGLVREQQVG